MNDETNNETRISESPAKGGAPTWWIGATVAVLLLLALAGAGLWWAGVLPFSGEGAVTAEAGLYHCPMHPTVVQEGPGDCPICGMALVPVEDQGGTDHASHDHEETLYQCPMHPTVLEDRPGDCPICGMALVEVEETAPPAMAGHDHEETLYQCPMHPTVLEDRPGDCPICGMALVEVEETSPPAATEQGTMVADAVEGYAPVQLPEARRQLIGVRTSPVERVDLDKTIRTVGEVEPDETRVRHIHTKITGWIEDLFVDYTGKRVSRGDPLLSIYSPELLATQEEYLLALRGRERLGGSPFDEVSGGASSLVEATRRRLELWDIPAEEIRRLEETGEPMRAVTLRSPIHGYVLHKTALEGMYVQPGKELFTIADLSRVWVFADVYEYELPLVEVGQDATLTISSYPGKTFQGSVDYVYPTLDRRTRTAKVRYRFPNPDLDLKPGMYANVEMHVDLGEGLAVPEEAVIDTGTRKIVFLALGDGWFAPVEVTVGRKAGSHYEVLAGLDAGDRVVTNGTFMIDSESRLRASIAKATAKGKTGEAGSGGAHAGH